MNRKYRIGVYLSAALLCILYCTSYRGFISQKEIVPETEPATEQEYIPVPAGAVILPEEEKTYTYYLTELDGYVAVYESDQTTLFETTSIRMDSLPKELQEEIQKKKGLADEHELYSFLENYSS